MYKYRGPDKSLPRPGRKQARKHVRDVRDFNNIETPDVVKFLPPAPLQGNLTETFTCFFPGRAKDLSAPCMCRVFKEECAIHPRNVSKIDLYR